MPGHRAADVAPLERRGVRAGVPLALDVRDRRGNVAVVLLPGKAPGSGVTLALFLFLASFGFGVHSLDLFGEPPKPPPVEAPAEPVPSVGE